MDKDMYEQWWKVHLRVASGEKLTPQEEAMYQKGLEILDREEEEQLQLASSVDELAMMKTKIIELQIEHSQLQLKSTRLDAKIVQLEQAYRNTLRAELIGNTYARP